MMADSMEATLDRIADQLVGWDITCWPSADEGLDPIWVAEVTLDGDVSVELQSSVPERLIAAGQRIDLQARPTGPDSISAAEGSP